MVAHSIRMIWHAALHIRTYINKVNDADIACMSYDMHMTYMYTTYSRLWVVITFSLSNTDSVLVKQYYTVCSILPYNIVHKRTNIVHVHV